MKTSRPGFPVVHDGAETTPPPPFVKKEAPMPSVARAMELARQRHALIHGDPTQEAPNGRPDSAG